MGFGRGKYVSKYMIYSVKVLEESGRVIVQRKFYVNSAVSLLQSLTVVTFTLTGLTLEELK